MADSKISALTDIVTLDAGDKVIVFNADGTSDRVYATMTEISAFVLNNPTLAGTIVASSGIPKTEIPNSIFSINTADQLQTAVSGTYYYVTSSALAVPASPKVGIIVGTTFTWDIFMTKSATTPNGAFTFCIYRGVNGSTGDTRDVGQSFGTQTNAVDSMWLRVTLRVTTTGATGGYSWTMTPFTKGVSFGSAVGTSGMFSGNVSSVNLTTASLKFGLAFMSTTSIPSYRIVSMLGWCNNLM